MRTLTAALLLVTTTALVACGSSTEGPLVGAGTGATAATTPAGDAGGTTAARDGRGGGRGARAPKTQDCAALGITVPPFNEGACVQNRQRFVVANGRSLMRLKTADVAIRGFSITEGLRTGREVLTPQGVFLVIRLKVKNTTDQPQRFSLGQTLLMLEQQRLQEHAAAEERFVAEALAFRGREPIPPGTAVDGSVVYDVPLGDVERITREGQLLVANFGPVREIGYFHIGAA